MPHAVNHSRIDPVFARLVGSEGALCEAGFVGEVCANIADFADGSADARVIFDHDRQVAGSQYLFASGASGVCKLDTEGLHATIAEIDHESGLIRFGWLAEQCLALLRFCATLTRTIALHHAEQASKGGIAQCLCEGAVRVGCSGDAPTADLLIGVECDAKHLKRCSMVYVADWDE